MQEWVAWNHAEAYDDECARQLLKTDRPRTNVKSFSYTKEAANGEVRARDREVG